MKEIHLIFCRKRLEISFSFWQENPCSSIVYRDNYHLASGEWMEKKSAGGPG